MKKNNFILNPFERIAGMKALGIGLLFITATVLTGYLSHTLFIGNLQVKLLPGFNLGQAFLVQGISLTITVLALYIAARTLTENVRFVDILGTTAFARYPFLLAALPGFFVRTTSPEEITGRIFERSFGIGEIGGLLIAAIIMLAIAILATILLYKAYKTSSGLKDTKLYWSFIAALILSEAASALASYAVV